jgi:chaperonin cofactor prefoldin
MKRLLFLLCFASPILLTGVAQTPDNEQQMFALIQEVQTQLNQIADNQSKIESKLAEVGENIRVSRIYSEREQ